MRHILMFAVLLGGLPGCTLYFGGDDDCDYSGGGALPAWELRDPQTGQCRYVGGGGGGGGGCGPGAFEAPEPAPGAWPDWAQCYGPCEGLDEASCVKADGCRAAYVDSCPFCDIYPPQIAFAGCWGTAPSGPIRGGQCEVLDAQTCSMHDDCSPVHARLEGPAPDGTFTNATGNFLYCQPEKPGLPGGGCYSDQDCVMGQDCTADTECLPPPGCDPATGQLCPAVCYGTCVPIAPPPACGTLGEAACIGRDDCAPLYEGHDCSCSPSGCTCSDWQFTSCASGGTTGSGFACGDQVCNDTEFCEVKYPGIPNAPVSYGCLPLPMQCLAGGNALSTCDCLKATGAGCGMACETDAAGHTTDKCFLP